MTMYDDSDEAAEMSKAWHDHKAKSTPALPPMDPEFERLVYRYEFHGDVLLAEIWSWVVAYGDRRAEEAAVAAEMDAQQRDVVSEAYEAGVAFGRRLPPALRAPAQEGTYHSHKDNPDG